jgi:hypothetical protein
MPGDVPENQISQVTDQPGPSAELGLRANANNPVASATEDLGAMFERHQQFADNAAHIAAINKFEDVAVQQLEDPKTGLFNQNLGMNAPGAADKAISTLEEQRSAIRETLSNDRQKMAYDRASDENLRMHKRRIFGWEHSQYKQAEAGNFQAALANSASRAVTMSDPSVPRDEALGDPVNHEVSLQTAMIKDYGHSEGWTPEMIDQELAKAKTATYSGVIEDMLSKENAQGAEELFTAHEAEILPQQREQLSHAIKTTSVANHAKVISDYFLTPGGDKLPVTRAKFLEDLNKDEELRNNAKLYDEVARRGENYFGMKEQAERAEQKDIGSTALKAIIADPTQDLPTAVGPLNWEKLDGDSQRSLIVARTQALKREGPKEFSQDYYDVRRLVGQPAFDHIDLIKYADKITPSELKELASLQVEQSQKGPLSERFTGTVTNNEIIGNAMKTLSIENNSDDELLFRQKFDMAERQEMMANGNKPLSPDAKIKIAKALTTDYVTTVQRSLYNPARWFGDATTQGSAGPLFKQPDDALIRREARKGIALTEHGLDREGLASWKAELSDSKSPNYQSSLEQLMRWKQGIADDGSYDPALKENYRVIRAELGK